MSCSLLLLLMQLLLLRTSDTCQHLVTCENSLFWWEYVSFRTDSGYNSLKQLVDFYFHFFFLFSSSSSTCALLFCASNLTYPKFSPPASNGLSSGAGVGGGGKMRRERGVHYVSKPGQEEQVRDTEVNCSHWDYWRNWPSMPNVSPHSSL